MLRKATQTVYLRDYKVPEYLIDKVDLEIELDEKLTHVKSHLTVKANPESKEVSKDLVLHGNKLELAAISLDSKPLLPSQYKVTEDSLILLDVPNKEFTLDIHTKIKPEENTDLLGLYKTKGNVVTQCEPEAFRRITYFLDRPDVMSRYSTKLIADEKKYPTLISNGNLVQAGKLDGGKHWAQWDDSSKKASYLFAIVAGDFDLVEDVYETLTTKRKITLQIYAEKGEKAKCMHAMETLKKAMRWDEENFGRECDLDVYKVAAISDFNARAMENKGLNILNAKYILSTPETATDKDIADSDAMIAHAYFHHWTGNRIPDRDWFQLSLKEGLSTFREQLYLEDVFGSQAVRVEAVNDLRTRQFLEDASVMARPVQLDCYEHVENVYTPSIYQKGAEIFRMMQTYLGKKTFRQGMDLYFERYDGKPATIEGFIATMQEVANKDLSSFLLWFRQAGTPVVAVTDEYRPATKEYEVCFAQDYPAMGEQAKQPVPIPIRLGLLDSKGQAIPLQLGSSEVEKEKVILFAKQTEKYTFSNVAERPVLSMFRGFSAPVKVKDALEKADMKLLALNDGDLFNRWNALYRYFVITMHDLINHYEEAKKQFGHSSDEKTLEIKPCTNDHVNDVVQIMKEILEKDSGDMQITARMLKLPSERYLIEQHAQRDVDIVHQVREKIQTVFAVTCKSLLLNTYNKLQNEQADEKSQSNILGKRALKNVCLNYLMRLNDQDIINKAMDQFKKSLATNMTDTIAVLRSLVDLNCKEQTQALEQFYQQWRHDARGLDYWFELQASSRLPGTLQKIDELLKHKDFHVSNPNRAKALLRSFAANLTCFHAIDGSGYALFAKIIATIDSYNPEMAAREIEPLLNWKYHDEQRQQLMRKLLQGLLSSPAASHQLKEKISKCLGEQVVITVLPALTDKEIQTEVVEENVKPDVLPSVTRQGYLDYLKRKKRGPIKEVNAVESSMLGQAADAVGSMTSGLASGATRLVSGAFSMFGLGSSENAAADVKQEARSKLKV